MCGMKLLIHSQTLTVASLKLTHVDKRGPGNPIAAASRRFYDVSFHQKRDYSFWMGIQPNDKINDHMSALLAFCEGNPLKFGNDK